MIALRSLRDRRVGTYAAFQSLSMSGSAMVQTLLPWFLLEESKDPAVLAWVANGYLIAAAVLNPLVGSISDRFGPRRVLLCTQILHWLYNVGLAYLVWRGQVSIGFMVGLAWVMGAVSVLDNNARHSFVKAFGQAHLFGMVSIHAALMNISRIVGPAIGAVLYGRWGFALCLLVNAASYAGMFANLLFARVEPTVNKGTPTTDVWLGFRTILRSNMKFVVSMAMVSSFAGHMFLALVPLLAKYTYAGDTNTLASFNVALALGSVSGALTVRPRPELHHTLVSVMRHMALMAGSFAVLGYASGAPIVITFALLVATGYGMTHLYPTYSSYLHAHVTDAMRARTMSAYASAHFLFTPIATAFAIWLFNRFEARGALLVSALACAACVPIWLLATRAKSNLEPLELGGVS